MTAPPPATARNWQRNRDSPHLSTRRVALGVTLAAVLLGALGCARAPHAGASVILIVVDTLRADHLSLAGYGRPTSPRLAEYAKRGTYFESFRSHSSWTRPSIATLLTSLMPRSHGIVTSGDALPEALTTLPEMLEREGYETLAFVANPQIHPKLGFAQGFYRFFDLYRTQSGGAEIVPDDLIASANDEQVLAQALKVLLEPRRAPYFAYIHLLDPHGPYTPDATDAAEFTDPAYTGDIRGSIKDFTQHDRLAASPADLAHFRNLYDAEVRGTDRDLGAFLDALDRAGRLTGTHVLVTADHGEEFLEHGGTGHGRKLFEESIHIPLLWLGPGVPEGRIVEEVGGLVDITPTLLDVLELAPRGIGLQGKSLRPLWTGEATGTPRATFLEEFSGTSEEVGGRSIPFVTRGLVLKGRKLLVEPLRLDRRRIEQAALYDLETDPGETAPRALGLDAATWSAGDAEILARYVRRDRAAHSLAPSLAVTAESLPEEDMKHLRSLGYLD